MLPSVSPCPCVQKTYYEVIRKTYLLLLLFPCLGFVYYPRKGFLMDNTEADGDKRTVLLHRRIAQIGIKSAILCYKLKAKR